VGQVTGGWKRYKQVYLNPVLVDLVSLLHKRLSFLWQKNFPEAITGLGVRVATFYEVLGILL